MLTTLESSDNQILLRGGDHIAVTIHLPAGVDDGTPRLVVFGLPGGGLSRGYWDVKRPEGDSYSQAEYHTQRGWIFVACDHLGVGTSSQPPPDTLSYARLAEATDEMVRLVVGQLVDGTLVSGVGPVVVRGSVGIGHSMGGCIAIVTQGKHATFDALAVLGFSAVHTVIPTPTGPVEVRDRVRDDTTADLETGIEEAGGVDMFRWAFYCDDVPPDLVEADMGQGYPRSGEPPPWGSRTTPPVVFTMLTAGVVAPEAATITSPVLIASGERDVLPNLRAEPAAYLCSTDITCVAIPGMAHMHNFAATRSLLWARIHRWAESILS